MVTRVTVTVLTDKNPRSHKTRRGFEYEGIN